MLASMYQTQAAAHEHISMKWNETHLFTRRQITDRCQRERSTLNKMQRKLCISKLTDRLSHWSYGFLFFFFFSELNVTLATRTPPTARKPRHCFILKYRKYRRVLATLTYIRNVTDTVVARQIWHHHGRTDIVIVYVSCWKNRLLLILTVWSEKMLAIMI